MTQKIVEKKVSTDIITLISKKIVFFEDVIQKTILHVQKNKALNIIGVSEVTNCINILLDLSKKVKEINSLSDCKDLSTSTDKTDNIINT